MKKEQRLFSRDAVLRKASRRTRGRGGLILAIVLAFVTTFAIAGERRKTVRFPSQKPSPAKVESKESLPPEVKVGDLHAVVVGVSKYRNAKIPKLEVADKDARDFADFLSRQDRLFNKMHITRLLNEDATNVAIQKQLFHELRVAGKHDTIIMYFSGHGADDPATPGEYFFIPYDGDPDFLEATAVNMTRMRFLNRLDSKRVVVIADTCHAGGFSMHRTKKISQSLEHLMKQFKDSEGRVIITSSRPDEFSLELDEQNNSVFTHYLLKGLEGEADTNGDGVVAVREAYDFVYQKTKDKSSGVQHPQWEGQVVGVLPLSLYRYPDGTLEVIADPPMTQVYLRDQSGFKFVSATDSDGRLVIQDVPSDQPLYLMLKKAGWKEKVIGPFVLSGDNLYQKSPVTRLEPAIGSVVLRTTTPDVSVRLGDKEVGRTDQNGILVIGQVQVGVTWELKLSRAGSADKVVEFMVPTTYEGRFYTSDLIHLSGSRSAAATAAQPKFQERTPGVTPRASVSQPHEGDKASKQVAIIPVSAPRKPSDTQHSSRVAALTPPRPAAQSKVNGQEETVLEAVVTQVDEPDGCLRIRSGPSSSTTKAGCAELGTKLILTGSRSRNNWVEISDPVKGWVYGNQIKSDSLSRLTPVASHPEKDQPSREKTTNASRPAKESRKTSKRTKETAEPKESLDPVMVDHDALRQECIDDCNISFGGMPGMVPALEGATAARYGRCIQLCDRAYWANFGK